MHSLHEVHEVNTHTGGRVHSHISSTNLVNELRLNLVLWVSVKSYKMSLICIKPCFSQLGHIMLKLDHDVKYRSH